MLLEETESKFVIFPVEIKDHKIIIDNVVNASDSIKEENFCVICFFLVLSPKMCGNCNKLFCSNCIGESIARDTSCPICRKTFIANKIQKPILNLLEELQVKCSSNCGKIMRYVEYPYHIQNCKLIKRKAQCLNCVLIFDTTIDMYQANQHLLVCPEQDIKCEEIGCSIQLKRNKKEDHLNKYCKYVKIECRDCKCLIPKIHFKDHDKSECIAFLTEKYEKKIEDEVKYYHKLIEKRYLIWNNYDCKNILTIKLNSFQGKNCIILNLNKDKETIVVGCSDGTIKILNILDSSIKIKHDLSGHYNSIRCLLHMKWQRDNTTIVSGSDDKKIIIWNVDNGMSITTLEDHTERVNCLIQMKWIFDDTTILSGSKDKTIKIWNANQGVLIRTLEGHLESVTSIIQIESYKDETTIVSCSTDNTVKIWNALYGENLATLNGHEGYIIPIIQFKWNINKTTIVTGSVDNTIKLWDFSSGKEIRTLYGHTEMIYSLLKLNWVKDDTTLISGSADKTIKIWNAFSGKIIRTLTGHRSFVFCLIQFLWSRDQHIIISGSYKEIKIWDIEIGICIKTLNHHTGCIFTLLQLTYTEDESKFFSASADNTIKIYKI